MKVYTALAKPPLATCCGTAGRLAVRVLYLGCIAGWCCRALAYILAHWAYLSTQLPNLPDWGEAAPPALEFIFPQILVSLLLLDIEHLIPLARSHGFDIHIARCKI